MICDKITSQQMKSKIAHFKHKLQAKITIRNIKHLILKKSYLDLTFLAVSS
jgi:hypothetical protein